MSKSIKNYSARLPILNYVIKIQNLLAENGATAILYDYQKGTNQIESLSFKLLVGETTMAFRLPTQWRKFQEILKRDNISRWDDDIHVQRVAWANMADWVEMQMVIYKLNMVELAEIFLPYAITENGDTYFNHLKKNPELLLGPGK